MLSSPKGICVSDRHNPVQEGEKQAQEQKQIPFGIECVGGVLRSWAGAPKQGGCSEAGRSEQMRDKKHLQHSGKNYAARTISVALSSVNGWRIGSINDAIAVSFPHPKTAATRPSFT